jgi:hypothetical protein
MNQSEVERHGLRLGPSQIKTGREEYQIVLMGSFDLLAILCRRLLGKRTKTGKNPSVNLFSTLLLFFLVSV